MSNTQKPTLGKYYLKPKLGGFQMFRKSSNDLPDLFIFDTDKRELAEFVCECANQCQAVNKVNPQAVAQNIRAACAALKHIKSYVMNNQNVPPLEAQVIGGICGAVLLAIEGVGGQ